MPEELLREFQIARLGVYKTGCRMTESMEPCSTLRTRETQSIQSWVKHVPPKDIRIKRCPIFFAKHKVIWPDIQRITEMLG